MNDDYCERVTAEYYGFRAALIVKYQADNGLDALMTDFEKEYLDGLEMRYEAAKELRAIME